MLAAWHASLTLATPLPNRDFLMARWATWDRAGSDDREKHCRAHVLL